MATMTSLGLAAAIGAAALARAHASKVRVLPSQCVGAPGVGVTPGRGLGAPGPGVRR